MARITVEDCLDFIPNRFQLVRLASLRAKQLLSGDTAVSDTKDNKAVVSALREIADGKVRFARPEELSTVREESEPGPSNGVGEYAATNSEPATAA